MVINQETIRQYYTGLENIQLPDNSKFRYYKLFLHNGRMMHIRKKIKNFTQLKKYLVKYAPRDVYYSTSQWLSPEKIKSFREYTYKYANEILLSNELSFDIDSDDLELARVEAVNLIDFLRNKDIEIISIRFSGSKGFHVICKYNDILSLNPLERKENLIHSRKILVSQIREAGIKIDEPITWDVKRVIRLPGTIHGTTGNVCTEISESLLRTNKRNIWSSKVPYHLVVGRGEISNDKSSLTRILGGDLRTTTSIPPTYTLMISNKVNGIKDRYTLILRYSMYNKKGGNSLKFVTNNIERLISIYNLSDFYIFKTNDEYFAICVETFPDARICKILNNSKSDKICQYKFHKTYIRVIPEYINGLLKSETKIEFVTKINGINNNCFVSRPHTDKLSELFGIKTNYPNRHGTGLKAIACEVR